MINRKQILKQRTLRSYIKQQAEKNCTLADWSQILLKVGPCQTCQKR